MRPHSKPFAGSAIASEHSVFFWARLKLTSIYVLILTLILIGFSVILYQSLARNLIDASDDNFAGIESHHHFVENTLADIENEIILIDLVILIVAAGVSYILAGYTLKPIQRSMEAQKTFSENASHELRTPLAVMKNDIEVLLRNPSPTKERIHATLRSSIEEIDHMSSMAQDLLALARSENHVAPAIGKIDLTKIARKIWTKMHPIADDKGIMITVSSDAPLYVRGSEVELERILTNLLQNAIEHTPKGGAITINTREDSQAVIEVSDTGSGIEKKDLPHIFERFYKGEGAGGTGLGLAIVKELMDQHGGSVEINSQKGKGTIVIIRLPIEKII